MFRSCSSLGQTFVLIALVFIWQASAAAESKVHPNIIVLMADDMGMGDTSAFQDFTGNADDVQVDTPNMERLARMGVRFTDAHTPASRCSPTRYGLLTGRYPWRNRLKYWVLFGSQGDPMIEADRPTIASMLKDAGYRTAMVGKWHVGLRYRQWDGKPAAGWEDADLTKPLHTTPVDHGFDYARFTSRSHGTSGPGFGKGARKKNGPNQSVGPGHIHGRIAIAATGDGKRLMARGPKTYVLTKLGSRHSDHAMEFLNEHVSTEETRSKPFFLYYPSNSNHGPYTPDDEIGGVKVKGASRTKSGRPMDARHDFVFENDVALGRLIDWLEVTNDPRRPGSKLIANTVVIFTSDNGAEKNSNVATGPFRSHKGSCYEGGHRVPFIVTWPEGRVGDGDESTSGTTNQSVIGLQDLYATFAEIVDHPLPNLLAGGKGAEDSFSVLPAFRGKQLVERPPLFFHDHKEAKDDPAVAAMRVDSPTVERRVFKGHWKVFFDAKLIRAGRPVPQELYDLSTDQWEKQNLVEQQDLVPLIRHLSKLAAQHRNSGGHRYAEKVGAVRYPIRWGGADVQTKERAKAESFSLPILGTQLKAELTGYRGKELLKDRTFEVAERGLGISGGDSENVDDGEAVVIRFNQDVLVESVGIVAGDGACGGFYQVGARSPLAIYCVDADIDAKDQSGLLSDIGVLRKGEPLRLDSSPHFGVESPGSWRLQSITIRPLP